MKINEKVFYLKIEVGSRKGIYPLNNALKCLGQFTPEWTGQSEHWNNDDDDSI